MRLGVGKCQTLGLALSAMSYAQQQRDMAVLWKSKSPDLPDAARAPAAWRDQQGLTDGVLREWCLPDALADHNLLPGVRQQALRLFSDLGIPWHAGIAGGPGNHLLSSQVQCANALTGMVDDADALREAFASAVQVGDVLEIEPGRLLTFEYIGPTDFFGEAPGPSGRVRGAHCTSVDAAFRHRASDGADELVLVEWKYTESYRRRAANPTKDAVRRNRYEAAVSDPNGPVRSGVLPFAMLLDEPFYQLVRQQLLAHALERSGVADRVRVVLVLPPENDAYQRSLIRREHRAVGATVSQVWDQLLRTPDRFTTLDPAAFLTPAVTSDEYVLRYSPDVIWDEHGLFARLDADDEWGAAAALEWDGYVELASDCVILRSGRYGTGLEYPFRLQDLRSLSEELDA